MTGRDLANYDIKVLYQSKSANTVRQIEQKLQDSGSMKQWSKSILTMMMMKMMMTLSGIPAFSPLCQFPPNHPASRRSF